MNFTDVVTAREVLTEALTALRTLGEGLAFVQEADLGDLAREASQMTALARGLLTATTMEAEARGILVDALSTPSRTDLSWIEQLIVIGDELGGVDLDIPEDQPATAADLSSSDQ